MILRQVTLKNFRCYEELTVELPEGIVILYGSNAQGKTAFLEALYLLAAGKSFRTNHNKDLIRWGSKSAKVSLTLQTDRGQRRHLEYRWQLLGDKLHKKVLIMNKPLHHLADLLKELFISLFTPADLNLIQGSPALRRNYLDYLLCKLEPTYLITLLNYRKALRQRNRLLSRKPAPHEEELKPWDHLISSLGSKLIIQRKNILPLLQANFTSIHHHLTDTKISCKIDYHATAPDDPTQYRSQLQKYRKEELAKGHTLIGPHRDDLIIRSEGIDTRKFGSQGQQRTASLCLRLCEAQLMHKLTQETPVILLDDCFSELDSLRRKNLLDTLQSYKQVFISTASPLKLSLPAQWYKITGGNLTSCWRGTNTRNTKFP